MPVTPPDVWAALSRRADESQRRGFLDGFRDGDPVVWAILDNERNRAVALFPAGIPRDSDGGVDADGAIAAAAEWEWTDDEFRRFLDGIRK